MGFKGKKFILCPKNEIECINVCDSHPYFETPTNKYSICCPIGVGYSTINVQSQYEAIVNLKDVQKYKARFIDESLTPSAALAILKSEFTLLKQFASTLPNEK